VVGRKGYAHGQTVASATVYEVLNNSIRLFTVRGIEVGVHYSWLVIFALLTWSLSVYALPPQLPRLPALEYWILGAITAILLFVSVLIHELAHSFVALARGLQARSITLFIFGGVSNLSGDAKSASTEFVVAIVGPLTSFALAAIAWAVATFVDIRIVDVVASYLVFINLSLGIFNLIPGFPLDGGRVLRAILWGALHNMRRATNWAANVGKVVAGLMVLAGGWLLFHGDIVSGVWLAAIAWFLYSAAGASVQQMVMETRLGRVRARDLAQPIEVTAPPGITITELVERYMLPRNLRAVAVTDNTRLVGIVTVSDVIKVPEAQRDRVTVGEVMGSRDGLVTVSGETPALDAIELLAERDVEQVPVLDGSQLVGMLTRADVMRQLQLRESLAPR
jgi:Zn-dependent protease